MANRKKINHLNKRSASSSSKQGIFRVIGGQWKGRKLRFIEVEGLRPSLDRVRETLFNWLQAEIQGAKCLDLFAGSGAIGIEALSRGADSNYFIELNRKAIKKLEQNIGLLETKKAKIFNEDAFKFIDKNKEAFDLIFIDPPFHKGMGQKVCDQLAKAPWLQPETLIYLEVEQNAEISVSENWQLIKDKKAGQLLYKLYKVKQHYTEKLFSYGTLQQETVQLETFGRKLSGTKETLKGYKVSMLKITDEKVVARSGEAHHPILEHTGDDKDLVEGTVYNISEEELSQADEYEVSDYERVRENFESGNEAWVYIKNS